eukprot:12887782-Prorocentrum_lima.AAC.1
MHQGYGETYSEGGEWEMQSESGWRETGRSRRGREREEASGGRKEGRAKRKTQSVRSGIKDK